MADPSAPDMVWNVAFNTGYPNPSIYGMAQRGAYLYAAGAGALVVLDVTNPAAPILITHVDAPGNPYGIGIQGQYALLLCASGLLVFDLNDPASPRLLTTFDTPGDARCMLLDAGRAYVAGSVSFDVIDVSSPRSLQLIGSLPGIPACDNLTRSGGFIYLNCPSQGVLCVSLENSAAPELVGYVSSLQGPHVVAATGNAVCVAEDTGLRVLPIQCAVPAGGNEIAPARALAVWPNPLRSGAEIRFALDEASAARLDLFDATGRLVQRVLDRPLAPGPHTIRWSAVDNRGRALPAGVYGVRLEAGGATRVGTAIILR